jgi:hypothetical protein
MTPAIDAEVARIMAMTDEEVLAEAKPDDLAWAERFKASIRTAIVTRPTSPPTPKEQARMAE